MGNSESSSRNEQVPRLLLFFRDLKPQGVYKDRLEVFLERGGCKESYRAYIDCKEEAEKNKEDAGHKCFEVLWKCMEAHPDYYKPFLGMEEAALKVMDRGVDAFVEKEEAAVANLLEKRFYANCGDTIQARADCMEEAGENDEDMKCKEADKMMWKCMEAHPDYFQPILVAWKDAEAIMYKKMMEIAEGSEPMIRRRETQNPKFNH